MIGQAAVIASSVFGAAPSVAANSGRGKRGPVRGNMGVSGRVVGWGAIGAGASNPPYLIIVDAKSDTLSLAKEDIFNERCHL